jgi:hypothetical protein
VLVPYLKEEKEEKEEEEVSSIGVEMYYSLSVV